MPARVIHSREDAALPAAVAQRVASGIPGTRLVWIDGAGHSSPFEASAAISDAIEHFVAAVSAAEPRSWPDYPPGERPVRRRGRSDGR